MRHYVITKIESIIISFALFKVVGCSISQLRRAARITQCLITQTDNVTKQTLANNVSAKRKVNR